MAREPDMPDIALVVVRDGFLEVTGEWNDT